MGAGRGENGGHSLKIPFIYFCTTEQQEHNQIHWIMEIAREFQKNIYFCFIDYAKAFDCVDHNCGKFWKRWEYQTILPDRKSVV